jgi:cytoskeletal protein CcmA (bactofilin family)
LLDNYYNNKKIKSILGTTSSLEGKLRFNDSIKINGSLKGAVKSAGLILIGEQAKVEADINAKELVSYGKLDGDVVAEESMQLFYPSEMNGKVKTKKIKISDGVIFKGNCDITSLN